MLNLLEKWMVKKTWRCQLPLIPYYRGKKGLDLDLAATIRQFDTLTLDLNSPTGFKEIGHGEFLPKYDFDEIDYCLDSIPEIAEILVNCLKFYISNVWDPEMLHLIFTSGGTDSRIISLILKELRDEKFDIGEVYFLCHGYEQTVFRKAMIEQGWKDKIEFGTIQENEYEWGNFEHNMNAFWAPGLNFYYWFEQKNICLVAGNYGGELLMYPTPCKEYCPSGYGKQEINLELLREYAKCPAFYLSQWYKNYDDFLMPYLNYEYLDICFQIKKEFFKRLPGKNDKFNWTLDLIRNEMLKILGNKTDVINERHKYSYKFTRGEKERIQFNWEASKLYDDFPEVRKFYPEDDFPNNTLATKLYGLATCYEEGKI